MDRHADVGITASEQASYIQAIRDRLHEAVGAQDSTAIQEVHEEVTILGDYVWQMVLEPQFSLGQMRDELTEFLGSCDDFLAWLESNVLTKLKSLREAAARGGVPIQVIQDVIPTQIRGFEGEALNSLTVKNEIDHDGGYVMGEEEELIADEIASGQVPVGLDVDGELEARNIGQILKLGNSHAILKVKKKCRAFPNCTFGEFCRFIHPNELCSRWPSCAFGQECFFLHPVLACKYAQSCIRWQCNYTHPDQ